jgi:taurine transport system substrate-binding protein
MNRLTRAIIAILLLAVAGLTGCSKDSGDKPAELRIGYQEIPNGDLIVKNQEWLEDELDIPIRWVRLDSGAEVNKALDDHAIDIGLIGTSAVALGVPSGLDTEVVWVHDIIGDSEALVVREESGLSGSSEVSDLEGRTVAVPFGSTAHYALLAALDEANVAANDVEVVDLQPDDMAEAWAAGSIDAAYVWEPTLTSLESDGGAVVLTSAELAEQGIVTGDLGVVSEDLAENYPDVVQTWVDVQARAVDLIHDDPGQAQEAIGAELDQPADVVADEMTGYTYPTAAEQAGPDYLGGDDSQLAQHLQSAAVFLKDYPQSAKFLKEYNVYLPDPTVDEFVDAIDSDYVAEVSK